MDLYQKNAFAQCDGTAKAESRFELPYRIDLKVASELSKWTDLDKKNELLLQERFVVQECWFELLDGIDLKVLSELQ